MARALRQVLGIFAHVELRKDRLCLTVAKFPFTVCRTTPPSNRQRAADARGVVTAAGERLAAAWPSLRPRAPTPLAARSSPRARRPSSPAQAAAAAAGNETSAANSSRPVWRWVDALDDEGGGADDDASSVGADYFAGTAYVYILTATWDPSRNEHAHDVCSRLGPASGSVCHVIEGVNGRLLTPEQKADFQAKNYVNLAPLPQRPWYSLQLPGLLRPLGREYPENMLRYPGGLGNTLGNIFILKMMQRVARSSPDDAVFIYLEDDADVGDMLELVERIKVMRRDLPAGGWDLISLAPPESTCERSRRLPNFPRSGLIRPRLSFSRTAGVVYSKRRARARDVKPAPRPERPARPSSLKLARGRRGHVQ